MKSQWFTGCCCVGAYQGTAFLKAFSMAAFIRNRLIKTDIIIAPFSPKWTVAIPNTTALSLVNESNYDMLVTKVWGMRIIKSHLLHREVCRSPKFPLCLVLAVPPHALAPREPVEASGGTRARATPASGKHTWPQQTALQLKEAWEDW